MLYAFVLLAGAFLGFVVAYFIWSSEAGYWEDMHDQFLNGLPRTRENLNYMTAFAYTLGWRDAKEFENINRVIRDKDRTR